MTTPATSYVDQRGRLNLGVLDIVTKRSLDSAAEDFVQVIECAKAAEHYGFTRYWLAQHYQRLDLWGDSTAAITLLLGATRSIRVGAGAVLLQHASIAGLASAYRFLSMLFANRVDLAVARTPASDDDAIALLNEELRRDETFEQRIDRLRRLLRIDAPLAPYTETFPDLWIVGSSKNGAKVARERDLRYARSLLHHGFEIASSDELCPSVDAAAVFVVCEETTEEASLASDSLRVADSQRIVRGDASKCIDEIIAIAKEIRTDEMLLSFLGPREGWPRMMERISSEMASRSMSVNA